MYFIRLITSADDLKAAQRIRAQIYREMRFLAADDLTDELDIDEHDSHALHIGAFDLTGQIVGTIRVVMQTEAELPVSKVFGIEITEPSVEISRYAILPDHRGPSVALGLCRAACHEVARRGIDNMYATIEKQLLESLLWLGFPFEVLGDPKWVYRSHNYPTLCRWSGVIPTMRLRDEERKLQTADYFSEPFEFGAAVHKELFIQTGGQG